MIEQNYQSENLVRSIYLMKKYYVRGKVLVGTAMIASLLASGCGDSENFVFTNTGTTPLTPIVPAAPVAANDAYNALGNATVTYSAANGVLVNDTVNSAVISSFDATGSNGGTVVLNADGSFTYTPVFGFVGPETFNYTLTNADGSSTATVTMTSTGEGFFVNNEAGTTGDGSQADPFDALTDAVAVAGAGDTIFVARGDGSNTGLSDDITLPPGVDLIGEGQGLILGQTIVPQGQAPVINATVTVSGDNTISGISFTDLDDAITGNNVSNLTIVNNTFMGGLTNQLQINLTNVSGAITINENTFNQDSFISSVGLTTAGTSTITANSNTFQLSDPAASGESAFLIDINDESNVTLQLNDNDFLGTSTGRFLTFCELDMFGDSEATLVASENNMSFHFYGFDINLNNSAQLTGTFTGNVSDQNQGEPDVDIDLFNPSQATMVFDNNRITNCDEDGFRADVSDTASLKLALRNNVIEPLDPTSDDACYLDADGDADLCAEITGNTFGGDLVFDNLTSGMFDVEQFGNAMGDILATLNTFTDGGSILVPNNDVNSISDGGCTIP